MIVVPGVTVQVGAVSAGFELGSHKRTVVASKFVVAPAVLTVLMSFVNKFIDCGVSNGPEVTSGCAVGTGTSLHMAPSTGAVPKSNIFAKLDDAVAIAGLVIRYADLLGSTTITSPNPLPYTAGESA